VFLTGPMFSNPALLEVGGQEIRSDPLTIDRLLPDVASASAIFVGHAHYDHLLDVPYVADKRAPKATIYGSATTKNILAGYSQAVARRGVALDADPQKPAYYSWYTGGAIPWHEVTDATGAATRLRFVAIESEHSPILDLARIFTVNLSPVKGETWIPWHGVLDHELTELPRMAAGWPAGRVFAYVIDFLDAGGQPVFRVYFQDSAARSPLGTVPDLHDGKRVDLALLCVGGARYIEGSPEDIIRNTNARYFILGHWEDFFMPRPIPLPKGSRMQPVAYHELPTGKTQRFVGRVAHELARRSPKDAGYCLPCPGSTLYFKDGGERIGKPTQYCR
jgi:Beta-lactamase superfamily domain